MNLKEWIWAELSSYKVCDILFVPLAQIRKKSQAKYVANFVSQHFWKK